MTFLQFGGPIPCVVCGRIMKAEEADGDREASLSIRGIIWILASDTVELNQYAQILRR